MSAEFLSDKVPCVQYWHNIDTIIDAISTQYRKNVNNIDRILTISSSWNLIMSKKYIGINNIDNVVHWYQQCWQYRQYRSSTEYRKYIDRIATEYRHDIDRISIEYQQNSDRISIYRILTEYRCNIDPWPIAIRSRRWLIEFRRNIDPILT